MRLVRQAGQENACMLVDALHFHSAGAPIAELAAVPASLFGYVHVCDGPAGVPASADERRLVARERRLFPGEGGINLTAMLGVCPAGIVCAVEVQNPARARALGAETYARLAREATVAVVSGVLAAQKNEDPERPR
jgi:sugar phosphate isomerase/epimerase